MLFRYRRPEFRETAIWRGIPGTWPARDFPLLCVASSPSSPDPDEGLCVLSGHLRLKRTGSSGTSVCLPHPGVAGKAGGSPTPEEVGGGAGDLCAAAQLPLWKPAGKERPLRLFPYGFMPCVWGAEGVELTMKVIVEGAFPGAFFGGKVEDAGDFSGCDVPTAASRPRVVGEKSVRVHGDLQAFGSRPGRKQRVDWGWVPREGDQRGIERRGVGSAMAVRAIVCVRGPPRF